MNEFKIKVQTLLDLIFYLREKERQNNGAKANFKENSEKYNWYKDWEDRHRASREDVEHYLMRLTEHEEKYNVWLQLTERNNNK